MAGNYDKIIKQAMGIDDPAADEPMLNYPVSTARVPPDQMRDTPYYISVPPDVGDQKTPPIQSNQDLDAAQQLARMRELSAQMSTMSAGRHDPDAFNQLMQEFDALHTARKAYLGRDSANEAAMRKQAPIDADVMMKAIENRQALGRSE